MRKFLFSFVAVLAFAGLFGLQGALSQGCPTPTQGFNCSGGYFYGTAADIECWLLQLEQFICGPAACNATWRFEDTEGNKSFFVYACPLTE
jgi:hypothetical protein